jgi:hypothetical protein
VVEVTQQYLVGEVSLRLAALQAAVLEPSLARAVAQLRREAETSPPEALSAVLIRTLEATDAICLDSLARGDMTAFSSQVASAAELREFGICAGWIEESG